MKIFFIIATLLVVTQFCFGQSEQESFINLTDTLIKNEIAMFNFKGTSLTVNNSFSQSTLTEIPLRHCNSKSAAFSLGSTFIHLYFKQNNPAINQGATSSLDSIFLVTHSHFWVRIPKSEHQGLFNIITCNDNVVERKKVISSPFFKAYQSSDKRRIYIYMIGGLDTKRYEVTWIIQESKFYTRTIDSI